MSDKILGIYIVASAKDKEERYAKYLYSALESVCKQIITIEEDMDYKKAYEEVSQKTDFDYVVISDTKVFGPTLKMKELIERGKQDTGGCYSIPHFMMIRKDAVFVQKDFTYANYSLMDSHLEYGHAFIPKSVFEEDKRKVLKYSNGSDLRKYMTYIEENKLYDTGIIYDYLARKMNLSDVKDSLNLTFVLPERIEHTPLYTGKKVAALCHMYYEELIPYNLRYLRNLPDGSDVYITTDEESKKEKILEAFSPVFGEHVKVIVAAKRGRELAAFMVECRDIPLKYDYFCFIHDKKSAQLNTATMGASFRDLLWDNMLCTGDYVGQVLNTFEEKPWLGMLIPPNVIHGTYFGTSADYWTICYDKVLDIAQRIGIEANIDRAKPPIATGSVFWCRPDAIRPLLDYDWSHEDFPEEPLPVDGSFSHALERVFPFVAQSQGYLSGIIMSNEYAQNEVTNLRYMLTGTIKSMAGLPIVRMTDFDEFAATTKEVSDLIYEGEYDPGLKRSVKNFINKHMPFHVGMKKEM